MQKIKKIYQELWQYYRKHLFKMHMIILAVYAVVFVVTGVVAKAQFTPEKVSELMEMYGPNASGEAVVANTNETKKGQWLDSKLEEAADRVEWYGVWYHNSVSNLLSIIAGIVPGIFLPAWFGVMNAGSWGATMGGIAGITEMSMWKWFLGTYAGHAIAEAIVNELGTAVGMYACWLTTRQIVKKNQPGEWKEVWIKAAQFWVLVIIPCLLVCGLLEQYFTGWLADLVMGPTPL